MIYRDEARAIKGVYNKSCSFICSRHAIMYGDNLADVEKFLRETPVKWPEKSSQTTPKQEYWDLNAGYDGALRMAKDGWTEGARDLDARLQAIIPASGREARWGYSVKGSSPHIGRYLSGHPFNMKTRTKRQAGSAPVFHIVINGNASCAVSGQQMANYGTALVGLIDRLENTGKRVQVDILYCLKLKGYRAAVGWNVKQASEHCDLSALAFSIAHPAAFRRIGFAMMERLPRAAHNYGYGFCADIQSVDLPDPCDGVMLLDGVNHEPRRCNSPQDALRLAVEQLNKAAVLAGHCTPDQPLIEEEEHFLY